MRSLPSILKYFMKPKAEEYDLPDTESFSQQLEEMVRFRDQIPDSEQREQEESFVEDLAAQPIEARPVISKADEDAIRQQALDSASAAAAGQITFARAQASALLQDAQDQASRIVEEARVAAEAEVARIHREAAEMGYKDGYSDGFAKGEAEGHDKTRAAAEQSLEQIQGFIEKAEQARDEQIDKLREELLDVAVAVAEKVIHVSLKSSTEVIKRMIITATEKLKRREWVQIYVADCDVKGMSQADPLLTGALTGLSDHVKIVPMREAEQGTCIVEMPDEIIDASAATQIENIRSIIRDSGF